MSNRYNGWKIAVGGVAAFVLFSSAAEYGWFDNHDVAAARSELMTAKTAHDLARYRFNHCDQQKENCWGKIDDAMWDTGKTFVKASTYYHQVFLNQWGWAVTLGSFPLALLGWEPSYLNP